MLKTLFATMHYCVYDIANGVANDATLCLRHCKRCSQHANDVHDDANIMFATLKKLFLDRTLWRLQRPRSNVWDTPVSAKKKDSNQMKNQNEK